MIDLAGKVAIVTGAAQGLGLAIVERLLEAGAAGVVAADVQQATTEHDARIVTTLTDVSDEQQVAAMVQAAMDHFVHIDILVNNAGICPITDWEDTTLESWQRVLDINLTGMLLCTHAVVPHLKSAGGGRIIYISSTAAHFGNALGHVGYSVSKAGVLALMKSVAKRFAADNILANAILPGPIETPMSADFKDEKRDGRGQTERPLLKRQAKPGEVADAVVYLASERSTYITGHEMVVDGGWCLG